MGEVFAWVVGFGEGVEDRGYGDGQGGDEEDGAFGAGEASGEDGGPRGVGGVEVTLHHGAGVGYAVEEGLSPVPGGVEANGPPERPGAVEGEAEDQAGQTGGEESEGGFAWVALMAEAEEEGEDESGGPEAEGVAVSGVEEGSIKAGEAAGEGVLEIAAGKVLLEAADEGKAEGPEESVLEGGGVRQEASIEVEEAGEVEGRYEEGQADESPGEALQELGNAMGAAEAEAGVGTALDLGHDEGDKDHDEEGAAFADDGALCALLLGGGVGGGGRGLLCRKGLVLDLCEDEVGSDGQDRCEDDEDEHAPTGADSIGSDEDIGGVGELARSRRGWNGIQISLNFIHEGSLG